MQKQIKTSMGGVCVYLEITDCTFAFCLQDFPLSHGELICLVMGHTSDSCTYGLCLHPWGQAEMWETFPQRILLTYQKCPISKKVQYKFWQYYHIAVLQAKQENTEMSVKVCVWPEKLSGMERRLSIACGASCGAPWLPTGGTTCKDLKGREEKDWAGLGPVNEPWWHLPAGTSGKASSAASSSGSQGWAPWCGTAH